MSWKARLPVAGHRLTSGTAVLALALAAAACQEKNEYVPPPPAQVTVAVPQQEEVTRYLEFTGNTAAINSVDLVARVEGFLMSIDYKDGAIAKKNDRLFLIQQDTYQANLDGANAALASANAQYTNAVTEYNRQATLGKQDFSSQAVVDKAKASMDSAKASVDSAKANVEIAQINLGYTTVTAPFDGIVTRHLADVGQLVGHNTPTTLATIVQVDPIYTYFTVSENQVLEVKKHLAETGRTLRDVKDIQVDIGLQDEDGFPHKGQLDYISPEVDPSTGTMQVRAIFDNKTYALLPGLFVRIRIPTIKTPNALLVDDTAIGTNQLGKYVLVVGADNVVVQKVVKVGQLEGQYRVIESGLEPGDRVIVGGIQRAAPGAKVDPQLQAAAPAAKPAP
ncbi:efflux RND transporter periplasmic adaptor subunit [Ancylobacter lacus]|nr:efflux RND transporter periplasmic adaptor subunit [Ancylobacter lacus]